MFLWIKTPCLRSKLWKLDGRYLGIDVLAKSRFHAMPWRIDSWIHVFVDGNGWFFNVFVSKNPLLEIHILKTIMVIMFLLHHCFMPWDPWNHIFEIHSCNVHSQYYDRRWFGEPKHGGRCFDGQSLEFHGGGVSHVKNMKTPPPKGVLRARQFKKRSLLRRRWFW